MTRMRLKLAYIESNSRRKACYKKRKKGFIKKVEELTTLCGVDACAIIYSQFDADPQIWPPSHSAVEEILMKFKNLSVLEQNRKMMSQESFTRQRIKKLQEQHKKLSQQNRQKEIKLFVSECLAGEARRNFSLADLNEMRWSIYFSIQTISRQIEIVKGQALLPAPTPTVPMMPNVQTSGVMIPTIQRAGKPQVSPEMAMNYSQNPSLSMSTAVQNDFSGFYKGCNPVSSPGVPVGHSQNPTRGMNAMVQNAQSAVVPSGMSMKYSENPAWGMNMAMQNEQFAGIGNGYNPTVALGMPTNYFQNPAQHMTTTVQNEQFAGNLSGYHTAVAPEKPVDYPQNPTWGRNTMVPNEQSTGYANGYDAAFAPQMIVNDPQNPTSDMNTMVPPEQSAGSSDFDWISYLFGDKGAGTGFTCP